MLVNLAPGIWYLRSPLYFTLSRFTYCWHYSKKCYFQKIIIFLFTGGAADKSGKLKVGDEILSVNSTDCTRMTRLEAWNFMKKLSDGYASLIVRQKIDNSRSRDMAPSASSGALSDVSCGNKSDSSLSDNSSSENDTTAATTASSSTGKPTTADLTAEQSLEGTKVEAKR